MSGVFFKWGIELCNGFRPEFGGHHYRLAEFLRVDYLCIHFHKDFSIGYFTTYYDGQLHGIGLGFLTIGWGGRPYRDFCSLGDRRKSNLYHSTVKNRRSNANI